ncbi:hypothetical protein HOP50_15g75730 [Chloropicon primus]|uniref:Clathrin light chain n=1 Tax=Chloropicon primus TaxID=1764295 RepID=A0A5B8MZT0_9CHLO|nr:hypothetical protein A3770_15p75480 [Chloropicon primus]UPR04238.1 hypothetical protein HOP50_15g75730 [Chloropicon primus]|eukprot:QDZ25030.1 hypothetical protein A3770_15p75480 [Chloropicon primus]
MEATEGENGATETMETTETTESQPLDLGFSSSSNGAVDIGKSSAESQKLVTELREKATKEKDQFYAEREKKIEAKKKQAIEEQGMVTEATVASGWEGVVELIELDDSKNEGRHDLTAMKTLLITLKHKGGSF